MSRLSQASRGEAGGRAHRERQAEVHEDLVVAFEISATREPLAVVDRSATS